MKRTMLLACALLAELGVSGCVTKIENTYYIQGDSNKITAKDTVSAKPDNQGLLDITGSAYGDANSQEGQK